jgi:16S rRNA (guanine1207-N2)-methyltransferase
MRAVYGAPPADLAQPPPDAKQTSPLIPGAADLAELEAGSLDGATILAPPGTLERRFVLAQALRALRPGAPLIAMAPKDKGGSRLGRELADFGCQVSESGKRHHRLCLTYRPSEPSGIEAAIAEGGPRQIAGLGWTQPGVFSWDRIDQGTARLIEQLPPLAGAGADLGCGVGVLAQRILQSPAVTALTLVDIDRRAVDCGRRNITDPRAVFEWTDARTLGLSGLDFVVMNPPFHDGGAEDRLLGQAFVGAAAASLKAGGVCRMVANRHLPYEEALSGRFAKVRLRHEDRAFKVYEAVR